MCTHISGKHFTPTRNVSTSAININKNPGNPQNVLSRCHPDQKYNLLLSRTFVVRSDSVKITEYQHKTSINLLHRYHDSGETRLYRGVAQTVSRQLCARSCCLNDRSEVNTNMHVAFQNAGQKQGLEIWRIEVQYGDYI